MLLNLRLKDLMIEFNSKLIKNIKLIFEKILLVKSDRKLIFK